MKVRVLPESPLQSITYKHPKLLGAEARNIPGNILSDDTDRDSRKLQGTTEAFRSALNRHGYGFQYAVLKHIGELKTEWRVDATEFPVAPSVGGRSTHIDFVLQHKEFRGRRIVAECKRADPDSVDWCFVRLPHVPQSSIVRFEVIQHEASTARSWVGFSEFGTYGSERVYHLSMPVRRGEQGPPSVTTAGEKGQAKSSASKSLDEAIAQVIRGANAFTEFAAANSALLDRNSPEMYGGVVIPAVFTTAKLWVSDADLSAADLASGKIATLELKPLTWLWMKLNVSPDLRHALPVRERSAPTTLREFLLRDYSRCVAIVSVEGIEAFLALSSDL